MGQICVRCLTSKLFTDQFMASTHCGLEICVQIASGNGLFSDGTKPFSEPTQNIDSQVYDLHIWIHSQTSQAPMSYCMCITQNYL